MEEIDIKDMFKYFLSKYKFILKFILVFFIIGFISSLFKFRIYYRADSNIIFENTSSGEINSNKTLMPTYFKIAKSSDVLNNVKSNLKLDISNSKLANMILLSENSTSKTVTISVKYKDKKMAEKIVNTLADEFVTNLKNHYSVVQLSVLNYSDGAYLSSNIGVFKNVIMLSIVGFIISCVILFFIYYFDDKIRTKEQLKLSKLGVLGYVLNKPKDKESFRTIRTNLNISNIKTILVTSPNHNEGKTYIATNLSKIIADLNKKVLLIDCDVNNSEIHNLFNINNDLGLVDINDKDISKSIQKTEIPNLFILPFGINNHLKKELFSDNFKIELDKLKEKYDYIILDTTYLLGPTDSLILSKLVDKIIIVTKYNQTKLKDLQNSIEILNTDKASVILNDIVVDDTLDKIKMFLRKIKIKNFKKDNTLIKVNKKVVKIENKKSK